MKTTEQIFLQENVGKLLFKFSTPAAAGMLLVSLSTIFDTILIGQLIGTEALAATSLAMPAFMMLSSVAGILGVGGSAVWSIDMGAKRYERASKVFTNVVMLIILLGILFTFCGAFLVNFILALMGTPPSVYHYAEPYIGFLLLSGFPVILTIGLNNFIRAEGKPITSLVLVTFAGLLIIVFDITFIYYLKWGIVGAGIGLLCTYCCMAAFVIYHFTVGSSNIKFDKRFVIPDIKIIKEILKVGTATFIRQFSIGVMYFIVNVSVSWYAHDNPVVYLAVISIAFKVIMFILMPVIGIIQGMQPIIGYNYGAKEYLRARKTVLIGIFSAVLITFISWSVCMLWPGVILAIFRKDPQVIDHGQRVIRILILFMPLVAAQTVGAGLFQILKKVARANFFAALRQIILLVPVILLLPIFLHLDGVWVSVPVADFLAVAITSIWVVKEIQGLKNPNTEATKAL